VTKASVKEIPQEILLEERAKRSFLHFLDYVYITEPRPDGSNSHIKFEKWDHLVDATESLLKDLYIVVPKPRQIGWSWLLAAYSLWRTSYNYNFKTLMFSQGEAEAYDLLAKVVYIWTHLPKRLQATRIGSSKQEIMFGPEWWLRAFPSTPKAGHGTTAGLVIVDEADYHEYLEQAYSAIKPTIDDVGGQLILVSKCNPYTPQSLFKRLARGAPHNGFKCLFYPWNVRENRTDEWYESVRATYTDPFEFSKSYPETLEEALEAPTEMRVVAGTLLEEYRNEIRKPIREDGHTKVWQEWVPGRRYIAASDTSEGLGLDKSVTVVVEAASGAIVAALSSRVLGALDFTVDSLAMLRAYGNPTWVIEVNSWGIRVADRAELLRYPRLWFRSPEQMGWKTTAHTRPLMWGSLIDAIKSRMLISWNEEMVDEMAGLVRDPDKNGRIAAADGSNDDYCTAVALALVNREYASSYSYTPDQFATLGGVYPRQGSKWKWA
jgi:hypothetical protein